MPVTIVQKDDPVLRAKAQTVPLAEIGSKKIKKIIKDMTEALDGEMDGVAIAAPQIGVPYRIIVISRRAFALEARRKKKNAAVAAGMSETTATKDASQSSASSEETYINKELVIINPEITKISKEKRWMSEGCLSVRYLYGKIQRSTRATIRGYDEEGKVIERGASGLLAQIFQHEVDHLNGILFIDSAKNVEDIPPEQINNSESN